MNKNLLATIGAIILLTIGMNCTSEKTTVNGVDYLRMPFLPCGECKGETDESLIILGQCIAYLDEQGHQTAFFNSTSKTYVDPANLLGNNGEDDIMACRVNGQYVPIRVNVLLANESPQRLIFEIVEGTTYPLETVKEILGMEIQSETLNDFIHNLGYFPIKPDDNKGENDELILSLYQRYSVGHGINATTWREFKLTKSTRLGEAGVLFELVTDNGGGISDSLRTLNQSYLNHLVKLPSLLVEKDAEISRLTDDQNELIAAKENLNEELTVLEKKISELPKNGYRTEFIIMSTLCGLSILALCVAAVVIFRNCNISSPVNIAADQIYYIADDNEDNSNIE